MRDVAIRETVERAAALCAEHRAGDPPLAALRELLTGLARSRTFFGADAFPLPDGEAGRLYELAAAPGGITLYLATSRPGSRQPPHAHCTWAVIAGIDGVELNTLFEPEPKPLRPGPGRLAERGSIAVGAGDSLAMRADDFHALEIPPGARSCHLHLYGCALDRLERAYFFEDGELRARTPQPAIVRRAA